MMRLANFPLYLVVEEEHRDVLVAAEELLGFFRKSSAQSPDVVVFLGVHEVNESKRRTEDAVLEIRNWRQRKIGEYFVGRAVLADVDVEAGEGKASSVSYRFFGRHCEYVEAPEIWKRWASDTALPKGEWLQWPASYHDAWLHVVQNSWFATGHRAARYGVDETVYLDGAQITSKPGFYCALGEAVNGPGGYFGSNLDALADCISSSNGGGPLAGIVWSDFQASRSSLDDEFIDSVMDVMREYSVVVSLR